MPYFAQTLYSFKCQRWREGYEMTQEGTVQPRNFPAEMMTLLGANRERVEDRDPTSGDLLYKEFARMSVPGQSREQREGQMLRFVNEWGLPGDSRTRGRTPMSWLLRHSSYLHQILWLATLPGAAEFTSWLKQQLLADGTIVTGAESGTIRSERRQGLDCPDLTPDTEEVEHIYATMGFQAQLAGTLGESEFLMEEEGKRALLQLGEPQERAIEFRINEHLIHLAVQTPNRVSSRLAEQFLNLRAGGGYRIIENGKPRFLLNSFLQFMYWQVADAMSEGPLRCCQSCGIGFQATHKRALYCTRKCKGRYDRRVNRAKTRKARQESKNVKT